MRVLLDCGPGVFAKLRAGVDYAEIDAIVISPPARRPRDRPRAVRVRAPLPARDGPPPHPRLIAPPGAPDVFTQLCAGGDMSPDHLELAFDLSVYDPADTLALGGLAVRFQPVPHYIPAQRGRVRRRRRAVHLRRRLRAQRRRWRVRGRHRPAAGRGDPARPEPPRTAATSRRARPASTRRRRRRRLRTDALHRRARADWVAPSGARVRRAVEAAREGAIYDARQ